MMYCKYCGTQMDDKANFCTNCGAPLAEESSKNNTSEHDGSSTDYYTSESFTKSEAQRSVYVEADEKDNGGCGWGLLGFCVPLVGLILYLVWKEDRPRTAKAAGKGALIAVIIAVALEILSVVLGIGVGILGILF